MLPLLFIDFNAPAPYDLGNPNSHLLGGAEATVIKIAHHLSKKTPVYVLQYNRDKMTQCGNVTYSPFMPHYLNSPWQAMVVLRNPGLALQLKALLKHPTPTWVWLHDSIPFHFLQYLKMMCDLQIGCIFISDFQMQQFLQLYQQDPYLNQLRLKRIYNPIEDAIVPDSTAIDVNKLLFISAPHKGLKHTLKAFQAAREHQPDFELCVSSPGYPQSEAENLHIPHVTYLGHLSQDDTLKQLRQALCLFYLNNVIAENFGLAFAEANAVGTPVMTHPLGAAPEILTPEQLINTHDLPAVITRLLEWRSSNRPMVTLDGRFRLSTIAKEWEDLIWPNNSL